MLSIGQTSSRRLNRNVFRLRVRIGVSSANSRLERILFESNGLARSRNVVSPEDQARFARGTSRDRSAESFRFPSSESTASRTRVQVESSLAIVHLARQIAQRYN